MRAVQAEEFLSRARSKKELCEFLNCTHDFINDAVKARKLRAYKLSPKFIRFFPEDIRDWLKGGEL